VLIPPGCARVQGDRRRRALLVYLTDRFYNPATKADPYEIPASIYDWETQRK